MKSISFNSVCLRLPPKKPMATHQASINIQEPTKFKLEATRTSITSNLNRTRRTLKFERNSKTKLYKFEQELSKQSEFESEPTATKP